MRAIWTTMIRYAQWISIHLAVIAACPLLAHAEPLVHLQAEIATDMELAAMRGGFTSVDGLEISFGIEQAVLVDGILQVATNFNTSSVTELLARQAGTPAVTPTITSAENIRSQVTTVIQNNLDQRVIDHITVINASINSLSLSRQMSAVLALQQLNIAGKR